MSFYGNFAKKVFKREIKESSSIGFQRTVQVTPDLVRRIGLEKQLEGHSGCVNCLEWNEKGSLLASGSDDVQVILWDPFRYKALTTIRTGHSGNIFSVKFLPNSNDSIIVSGAADCKIRVHDLNAKETTHVFGCHAGRVKRLATAPNVPFMFWSAAEDGTVMQFDLRTPESCNSTNPKNVLVNLHAHLSTQAEAKCLAINPMRTEQMAVGANDPYVRLYDRRMLTCRGIKFPTDASSRSSWERQNLLAMFTSPDDYSIPDGAATYYVAGHLPQKQKDYRKRYRTLASTYLTFGPDGSELLVNLGGEQIYLFDVNKQRSPQKFEVKSFPTMNGIVKDSGHVQNGTTNGFTVHCNGTTTNGIAKHLAATSSSAKKDAKKSGPPLPPAVESIKQKAKSVFEKQNFTQAVLLYNQAIAMAPDAAVLYGNRALAYMKREWDGDVYSALRDCHSAIHLDAHHLKAHFRLAKCLCKLSWHQEALECLELFKERFPDYAKSHACEALEKDIRAAIFARTNQSDTDSDKEERSSHIHLHTWPHRGNISDQEKSWRSRAHDYELRLCGHCNTTTDIKEANFLGSNGQYIMAGSDDGSFYIWERATTNIVRVLRGDESIVNCLQPNPTQCLLATSGIDPVVRLWSPRAEDGQKDEREVNDSADAASANQKRMNADPLEVMLMNMGYRISGNIEGDDGDDQENPVQCRPS